MVRLWEEADSDLVRARWLLLGIGLNQLAPLRGLDPVSLLAMARLEGGDSEHGTRENALFGIRGEYGPILSGRTAEMFGVDEFRVDRDWYHQRAAGNFRSYPTPIHQAADAVRMLSSGRYEGTQGLAGEAFFAAVGEAGYHPDPDEWSRRVTNVYDRIIGL